MALFATMQKEKIVQKSKASTQREAEIGSGFYESKDLSVLSEIRQIDHFLYTPPTTIAKIKNKNSFNRRQN